MFQMNIIKIQKLTVLSYMDYQIRQKVNFKLSKQLPFQIYNKFAPLENQKSIPKYLYHPIILQSFHCQMDPIKNQFNTNSSDKNSTGNPFQNNYRNQTYLNNFSSNQNSKNSLQPITQNDQFLLDDVQTQQKKPQTNFTNIKSSNRLNSNQYALSDKRQNDQLSSIFQTSSKKFQSNQKNINLFPTTSSKQNKHIQYSSYSQNIKQLDDDFQMLIALNQNKSNKQLQSNQHSLVPQRKDINQKEKKNQQRFQRLSIQIGRKSGQFFKQSVARRKTIGPSLSINQIPKNQASQAKNQQKKMISTEPPKQIVSLEKNNIPIQKMELQIPKQQIPPFSGAFASNQIKTPTKQTDKPFKALQPVNQNNLNKTPTHVRPVGHQNSKSKICKQRVSMDMNELTKYLESCQQQVQNKELKQMKRNRLTLGLDDLAKMLAVQNQKEQRIKLMTSKKSNNIDSKQPSMKKKNDNQLLKKEQIKQIKNLPQENKITQQKDKHRAFLQYTDRNGVNHKICPLGDSQESAQQFDPSSLTPNQMQKEVFKYFIEPLTQFLLQQQSQFQFDKILQKHSDKIDEQIEKKIIPQKQQINSQKQKSKNYKQQVNQLNQEKNQIIKKLQFFKNKYTKQKAQTLKKKLSSFQAYLGMKVYRYSEDKDENKNKYGINLNKTNKTIFQGFYSVVIYKNMLLKFKRTENTQFAQLKIIPCQDQESEKQSSNFSFSDDVKFKLIQRYVETKLTGAKTFIQVLVKLRKYCKILSDFQITLQLLLESIESDQIELSSDGLKLNMKFNWNEVHNSLRRSMSSNDVNRSQFELTIDLLSLLQDGGIDLLNIHWGRIILPEQCTRFSQNQSKLARVFNYINTMVINRTEDKIDTKIEELNMVG